MPPTGEFARRRNERGRIIVDVAEDAVALAWEWPALIAADGNEISVNFRCSVRAMRSDADRQLLAEVLLCGRDHAAARDVSAYFAGPLGTCAARIAATMTAETAVASAAHGQWVDQLSSEANRIAFAAGAEALAPMSLQITSPSLDRARRDAAAEARETQAAAKRVERLRRTGAMLDELRALREKNPKLSSEQLLSHLDSGDRAQALGAMLAARSGERVNIMAASGDIVHVTTAQATGETLWTVGDKMSVTPELGSLRSVACSRCAGRDVLLLGAQFGVIIADAQTREVCSIHRAHQAASQRGFASVLIDGDLIVGRHAAFGVLAWQLEGASPACILASAAQLGGEEASGPLALLASGSYLAACGPRLLLVGDALCEIAVAGATAAPVLSMIARDDDVLVVRADSSVDSVPRDGRQSRQLIGPGGPITAAAALQVEGSVRLLMANPDGVIRCIGIADDLVTEYRGAGCGLKMLAASGSVIAAVSDDRMRLFLWCSFEGRMRAVEQPIGSIGRHRIAGIAVMPSI